MKKLHHKTFFYCVYGLCFISNLRIPGIQPLQASGEKRVISVTMGKFPKEVVQIIQQTPAEEYYVEKGEKESTPPHLVVTSLDRGNYFLFSYAGGVQFLCDRETTHIWGSWQEPLTPVDASLFLMGPILGFILRLRCVTCLHASGVVVDGQVFAITGSSGSGKSTLAAAFAAAGYPILTDDILPLLFRHGILHALPGYGRIRLYPDSFKNMADLPDDLPSLTENWNKCYLDLTTPPYTFHNNSIPLKSIYVLDWKDVNKSVPEIVTLHPTSAVPLLAINTYRNELLDYDMKKNEFYFLGQLASAIPVRTVKMVDNMSELSTLVQLILHDFHRK